MILCRGCGDLYRIGENLFHQIFLQYKCIQGLEKYLSSENFHILYSQKYWRELNLAVGSQIAIATVLADRHTYICE